MRSKKYTVFIELKSKLEEGRVALTADFPCNPRDDVHPQHWDHEATTIFPYYPPVIRWDGRM